MTEDQFWRIQGRLNAIELLLMSEIFNMARLQPDPFPWMQRFIEATRFTSRGLAPDIMPDNEAARLTRETRDAVDEFLEQVVVHAGHLPGAPQGGASHG
ncbi:hypothetical protein [Bradyrhizobium sp. BR13661]|jgi:hypothetical protein|uniref:hypothetical protein n=1 Tax=Bradyrhizobium sp. BR13661 TaxID=2940622 RepID=UPI002476F4B0|nr:hypothetical protein [Bradyrhizobium sp. BR13661]MDH6259033.1 hypothetical protein [Bradyrhizobium sp. BR13661]